MVGTVPGLLYRARQKLGIGRNNLLELNVGLPTGVALIFIPSLFYIQTVFQTYLAVLLLTAPSFVGYRMVQLWTMRRQLNPPQRRFTRNVFAMLFVMGPLLFLVPINYWIIANTIFASMVLAQFCQREKKLPLGWQTYPAESLDDLCSLRGQSGSGEQNISSPTEISWAPSVVSKHPAALKDPIQERQISAHKPARPTRIPLFSDLFWMVSMNFLQER
jgi:hypothetical protein